MDKKAFDRARDEFAKKTASVSEEDAAARIKVHVSQTRSAPPPTIHLLGVTYATSQEVGHSEVSLTLESLFGA